MKSTLREVTTTATFEDCREVIKGMTGRFASKVGGELDDLVGEASVAFMQAYDSYDPSKGPFEPWLRLNIRRVLTDAAAKISYRAALLSRSSVALERIPQKERFSLARFLEGLTLDGAQAVGAAIDAHMGGAVGNGLKAAVRRTLLEAGWEMGRVEAAFLEVGLALEG